MYVKRLGQFFRMKNEENINDVRCDVVDTKNIVVIIRSLAQLVSIRIMWKHVEAMGTRTRTKEMRHRLDMGPLGYLANFVGDTFSCSEWLQKSMRGSNTKNCASSFIYGPNLKPIYIYINMYWCVLICKILSVEPRFSTGCCTNCSCLLS